MRRTAMREIMRWDETPKRTDWGILNELEKDERQENFNENKHNQKIEKQK